MAQTILYYPTINIKDGQWLRNALLYWDNISSIVPYEGYEKLSPDLLFLQRLGVYEAIYPQDLFSSQYSNDFCKTILRRISDYEYRTVHESFWSREKTMIHRGKLHAEVIYELIYNNKLTPWVSAHLIEKEHPDFYNYDKWMEMDAQIARIYMRTLAEFSIKCSPKDIILGTDKPRENQEIYCYATPQIDNQCCCLNIIDCLPQPSLETSFEDILEFKSRRRDELKVFRDKIQELEENIYRSRSIEEIKHYEHRFVESWQIYHRDYCKVLRDSRINFVLGNLGTIIAIPYVGELLAEHIGQDFSNVIQTSVGLLQMGINYIDYRNKINPKTDGGFSYIISAREEGLTLG